MTSLAWHVTPVVLHYVLVDLVASWDFDELSFLVQSTDLENFPPFFHYHNYVN